MLIRAAEVSGERRDLRVAGGHIAELAERLTPRAGEEVIEAGGGALLPGLHDHHLHLFALAVAQRSVRCGPPQVADRAGLAAALCAGESHAGWLRGVGYHESVAGALDRRLLDGFDLEHPVRIQHRSGAQWGLNSRGIAALGLDAGVDAPGVERDAAGAATGRLFGLDAWLRERLPRTGRPDLTQTGRRLAACGVTGVTDASVGNGPDELRAFSDALMRGELRQRLVLMGSAALPEPEAGTRLSRGAVKLVLNESRLPELEELTACIAEAHAAGRGVAIHCVTRVELVLATVAFGAAGGRDGDRIEHAAVAPDDLMPRLAALPLSVVTQPNFVAERGDAYRVDVEPRDRPWLYRCRGFLTAGVPVGAGTDAPFGDPDPWRAMRAAVERRTANGAEFGASEALTPEQALSLFTTRPDAPGAAPRRIAVGAVADLCLLDTPWSEARLDLSARHVRAAWCDGAPL